MTDPRHYLPCPACRGTGAVNAEACSFCEATGRIDGEPDLPLGCLRFTAALLLIVALLIGLSL